jgi:glycosyltransferase involved in cell wall biosynthesis
VSTVSFIVPTIGRPSLVKTLRSIETYPGDEILVVGDRYRVKDPRVTYVDCEPFGDWGHGERNLATPYAKGDYVAHIDDDDIYAPGTRALMEDAMTKTPGRPVIWRMRYPCGVVLWQTPEIKCGNIGTPCFLMANQPEMFGTWGSFVGGDCAFLESSKWKTEDYVWRPEIIALLGHDV